MKRMLMKILLPLLFSVLPATGALAMGGSQAGCGAGSCSDCHNLTVAEAKTLLKGGVDAVHSVDFAEMPGVWAVDVEKDKKRFPVYIDFSKSYVVAGNIIRLQDGKAIAGSRQPPPKPARIDVNRIPLGDALLLGRADAKTKVVVFTDPQCPWCKKLHAEIDEVVKQDPDIAFLIKLFPLRIHPEAYTISKSIICLNSLDMLEASLAGKPVPPPLCDTPVVDQTLALARELGINSTPTLILPDGSVIPGSRKADELLRLLGSKAVAGSPSL